jgi:hypothetical protein
LFSPVISCFFTTKQNELLTHDWNCILVVSPSKPMDASQTQNSCSLQRVQFATILYRKLRFLYSVCHKFLSVILIIDWPSQFDPECLDTLQCFPASVLRKLKYIFFKIKIILSGIMLCNMFVINHHEVSRIYKTHYFCWVYRLSLMYLYFCA